MKTIFHFKQTATAPPTTTTTIKNAAIGTTRGVKIVTTALANALGNLQVETVKTAPAKSVDGGDIGRNKVGAIRTVRAVGAIGAVRAVVRGAAAGLLRAEPGAH